MSVKFGPSSSQSKPKIEFLALKSYKSEIHEDVAKLNHAKKKMESIIFTSFRSMHLHTFVTIMNSYSLIFKNYTTYL